MENIIDRYEVTSYYAIPIPMDGENTDLGINHIDVTLLLSGFSCYNTEGVYEAGMWYVLDKVTYKNYKYTFEGNKIIKKWIDDNFPMLLESFHKHAKWVDYVKRKKIELRNYKNCIH